MVRDTLFWVCVLPNQVTQFQERILFRSLPSPSPLPLLFSLSPSVPHPRAGIYIPDDGVIITGMSLQGRWRRASALFRAKAQKEKWGRGGRLELRQNLRMEKTLEGGRGRDEGEEGKQRSCSGALLPPTCARIRVCGPLGIISFQLLELSLESCLEGGGGGRERGGEAGGKIPPAASLRACPMDHPRGSPWGISLRDGGEWRAKSMTHTPLHRRKTDDPPAQEGCDPVRRGFSQPSGSQSPPPV